MTYSVYHHITLLCCLPLLPQSLGADSEKKVNWMRSVDLCTSFPDAHFSLNNVMIAPYRPHTIHREGEEKETEMRGFICSFTKYKESQTH